MWEAKLILRFAEYGKLGRGQLLAFAFAVEMTIMNNEIH